MDRRNGGRNGRPSPYERHEEYVREDRRLKREVDDALRDWDRVLEEDQSPASPPPQRDEAPRERV